MCFLYTLSILARIAVPINRLAIVRYHQEYTVESNTSRLLAWTPYVKALALPGYGQFHYALRHRTVHPSSLDVLNSDIQYINRIEHNYSMFVVFL